MLFRSSGTSRRRRRRRRLASAGEVVADFNPFVPGREAEAVFEPVDAFYVPVAGQAAVRAAGPRIRIYRLAPVQ